MESYMRRLKSAALVLFLGATVLSAVKPLLAQQTGTLAFDVENYTTNAKIPKNAQKSLEHAGVQWGMVDNTVVISLVSERFVKVDTPYHTRWGEQKTLDLKAGQYTITCIGFEPNSTSSDPDKSLSKSAFFNNDVVAFTVLPGKTTKLEISTKYLEKSLWRALAKINVYTPEITLRVLEDGTQKSEDVVISRRTDKSVDWDDYKGPLKF
jgi:hypothetical protein